MAGGTQLCQLELFMLGSEGLGKMGYTFPASPGNLQMPDAHPLTCFS